MRTDVKLGFVIGGILLAVMIVYAVVVGRGGNTAPQQTASLTTPDTQAPVDATSHAATDSIAPGTTASVSPAASIADEPLAMSAPLQTTTPNAATDPFVKNDTASATKWNWERLLHEGGSAPNMMASDASAPVDSNPIATRPPTDVTAVSFNSPSNLASPVLNPSALRPAAPLTTQPTGRSGKTHVVKSGETLSSISFASYGSARHYSLIARANPTFNPDKLKVGMILTIPEILPQDTATKAPLAQADAIPVDPFKQYKVQPGDTLHKIALKLYGKAGAWEKIYDTNKSAIGTDPGKLKTGIVLTLPEKPIKEKPVQ